MLVKPDLVGWVVQLWCYLLLHLFSSVLFAACCQWVRSRINKTVSFQLGMLLECLCVMCQTKRDVFTPRCYEWLGHESRHTGCEQCLLFMFGCRRGSCLMLCNCSRPAWMTRLMALHNSSEILSSLERLVWKHLSRIYISHISSEKKSPKCSCLCWE